MSWTDVLNTYSGWNCMNGVGLFRCAECGAINYRGKLCYDCWAEFCNTDTVKEMIE